MDSKVKLCGQSPLEIVIIGGSLAGLIHGIMLKSLGHNVHILEQSDDIRESHMAGVCSATDAIEFLRKYDRIEQPFCLISKCLQALNPDAQITFFLRCLRAVSSWDALYYRLRANFDGYKSDFYPNPPSATFSGAGTGFYDSSKKVTDLVVPDGAKPCLQVQDLLTNEMKTIEADLVIGADGPNSYVRTKFLPSSERLYSGYVAWRGVVKERDVSEETKKAFSENVTLYLMKNNHALVYNIPGENGKMGDEERLLNFLWYTNETAESLEDLMTDVNGHKHRYIVPGGKIREEVWQRRCDIGNDVLAAPFKEVINKISVPFLQVITDFKSPRASFADGKVLLVGDAMALMRPHTAFSTTQAAFHCLALERYMKGEIGIDEWEREVLRFSDLHWRRSVKQGEFYQRHPIIWAVSALNYWVVAGMDIFWNKIFGYPSNLRE